MAVCPCTRLQDALDELARHMHAALGYLDTAHDFVPLSDAHAKASDACVQPDTAAQFAETLHALSAQLVDKARHTEALIDALPGVHETEAEQLQRLAALETELGALLAQRAQLNAEREQLQGELGRLILCLSSRRSRAAARAAEPGGHVDPPRPHGA